MAGGHECPICGKSYATRGNCVRHMLVHTGEKPHACAICGKEFAHKSTLEIHVRVHTGEKPFKCNTCGRGFSVRCNLLTHIRLHTGEKPYQCGECEYRSSDASSLKAHKKRHSCSQSVTYEHAGNSTVAVKSATGRAVSVRPPVQLVQQDISQTKQTGDSREKTHEAETASVRRV